MSGDGKVSLLGNKSSTYRDLGAAQRRAVWYMHNIEAGDGKTNAIWKAFWQSGCTCKQSTIDIFGTELKERKAIVDKLAGKSVFSNEYKIVKNLPKALLEKLDENGSKNLAALLGNEKATVSNNLVTLLSNLSADGAKNFATLLNLVTSPEEKQGQEFAHFVTLMECINADQLARLSTLLGKMTNNNQLAVILNALNKMIPDDFCKILEIVGSDPNQFFIEYLKHGKALDINSLLLNIQPSVCPIESFALLFGYMDTNTASAVLWIFKNLTSEKFTNFATLLKCMDADQLAYLASFIKKLFDGGDSKICIAFVTTLLANQNAHTKFADLLEGLFNENSLNFLATLLKNTQEAALASLATYISGESYNQVTFLNALCFTQDVATLFKQLGIESKEVK